MGKGSGACTDRPMLAIQSTGVTSSFTPSPHARRARLSPVQQSVDPKYRLSVDDLVKSNGQILNCLLVDGKLAASVHKTQGQYVVRNRDEFETYFGGDSGIPHHPNADEYSDILTLLADERFNSVAALRNAVKSLLQTSVSIHHCSNYSFKKNTVKRTMGPELTSLCDDGSYNPDPLNFYNLYKHPTKGTWEWYDDTSEVDFGGFKYTSRQDALDAMSKLLQDTADMYDPGDLVQRIKTEAKHKAFLQETSSLYQ